MRPAGSRGQIIGPVDQGEDLAFTEKMGATEGSKQRRDMACFNILNNLLVAVYKGKSGGREAIQKLLK